MFFPLRVLAGWIRTLLRKIPLNLFFFETVPYCQFSYWFIKIAEKRMISWLDIRHDENIVYISLYNNTQFWILFEYKNMEPMQMVVEAHVN